MNALTSRLYKLEDRLGLGNETLGQLHLRALREDARSRMAEKEGPEPLEDEPPVEAWRLILLSPRR